MISSYVFKDLLQMPQKLNLSGVCPQFGIFTLNFINAEDRQPLHFAFRVDQRQIAINDNLSGEWGAELHVDDVAFPLGLPFELTIELHPHRHIRLSMQGKLLHQFNWRCDPATAVRLDIAGADFSLFRDDRDVPASPERAASANPLPFLEEHTPAGAALGDMAAEQIMERLRELADNQRAAQAEIVARIDRLAEELADLHRCLAGIPSSPQAAGSGEARQPAGFQRQETSPKAAPPARNKSAIAMADDFRNGWGAWRHHQNVKLGEGGVFTIKQDRSTPGIARQPVAVEPDTFYRFTILGAYKAANRKLYTEAYDPDNDLLLTAARHVEEAEAAATSQVFMTTGRTKRVVLRVLIEMPKDGDECRIESAKLESLGRAEQYVPEAEEQRPYKICASLASVAGREAMVVDAVHSLYPFVDKVRVYLNGYDAVPEGLKLPRVEIARSQDHGDDGDAGKFFWVENKEFDLNLICDDDMIFPPDFADKMVAALERHDNKAIIGVHGILLKQPTPAYYHEKFRQVRRYIHGNGRDYQVHVLGTGAILYDARMLKLRWRDFQYRNMADIWLMEQAQKQGIPSICVERPRNWIIQNKVAGNLPTIYSASHGKTGTGFDTGTVQTAVVKDNWPVTLQPLVEKGQRRQKVVLSITTWNRCDYLKECIESFERTRSPDYDWVLIVADDGSTDGTLAYLDSLVLQHEVHVIRNKGRYACGQTNTIIELCQKIGFDFAFKIDDDVLFKKRGWDKLYVEAARAAGYPHLCHYNWQRTITHRRRTNPNYALPKPHYDPSGRCETVIGVWECNGCLFTFTPEVIEKVGYCDEKNFPIRGQWHIDYSIRCCRGGFNDAKLFYDARDSNQYIDLQENKPTYRCSLPWGDEYKKTKDPAELARREAVMRDESRIYIPLPSLAAPALVARSRGTVNEFFDKVFVLNLDRRADRLHAVKTQLETLGIEFERVRAVDGKAKPHIDEWLAYSQRPLLEAPKSGRKVTRAKEFYLDHDGPVARTAYLEGKLNAKAIRTPGAWGYMKSYIGILERALHEGYGSILVLDDDAVFHRAFNSVFSAAVRELPEDWRIFQLGALQYDWGEDWITEHSQHLYRCNGSSVGSHATGIHRSVIPALLHQASRFDMPFDVGALSAVKRAFADKSFTVIPNLIIQGPSESDISSSDVQQDESRKRANVYRWVLDDYPIVAVSENGRGGSPALAVGDAAG